MSIRAKGTPTKAFFVEMLTRDIGLNDAILDLLDNCLDGVVKLASGRICRVLLPATINYVYFLIK